MEVKKHTAGSVPQYYPMNQVGKMLVSEPGAATAGSKRNAVKAVHRDSRGQVKLEAEDNDGIPNAAEMAKMLKVLD